MARQSINWELLEDGVSQAQNELLEILLTEDFSAYPWNPADSEAEVYFTQSEAALDLDSWEEEEIQARSQNWFATLEACFSGESSLEKSLAERFTAVPQAWLDAIARKSKELVSTNVSAVEQLVQVVQELLPDWAEDDLFVFARPVAYAMRGDTDAMLSHLEAKNWDELSEVEQARLSLAIAQYALNQLNS